MKIKVTTIFVALGLFVCSSAVQAEDYKLIGPIGVVPGPKGRVAGAEDVAPIITRVSRDTLTKGATKSGTTEILITGKNFSPDDIFKLNKKKLNRRYLSTTKIRVTIPVDSVAAKKYKLRLIHEGQEVSVKTLTIIRAQ